MGLFVCCVRGNEGGKGKRTEFCKHVIGKILGTRPSYAHAGDFVRSKNERETRNEYWLIDRRIDDGTYHDKLQDFLAAHCGARVLAGVAPFEQVEHILRRIGLDRAVAGKARHGVPVGVASPSRRRRRFDEATHAVRGHRSRAVVLELGELLFAVAVFKEGPRRRLVHRLLRHALEDARTRPHDRARRCSRCCLPVGGRMGDGCRRLVLKRRYHVRRTLARTRSRRSKRRRRTLGERWVSFDSSMPAEPTN